MAAARGRPVVAISSDAVYSDAVRGEADEDSPVDPVSLYGESKLRLERIVEDHAGVILRFPSCFGPTRSMRDDLLVHSLLREHLAGTLVIQEPETTRSLLHVQDAASAVCSVLAHPTRTAGQTYNAASGSWTKRQIGQTLCKVFGGEITFEDAPRQDGTAKRDFTLNCGKLARATGWRPRLSILCGLIQLRALERARAQQRG
jgi:nucleoside-diphosphate-sugar epimerase